MGLIFMPTVYVKVVLSYYFRVPYESLFGGITAFKNEHFVSMNGYSNAYFGWGGEDDDLYHR